MARANLRRSRLEEGLTSPDHSVIMFHIKLQRSEGISITRTTRKYNSKKANWEEFDDKLDQLLHNKNITSEIERIDNTKVIEETTQEFTETLTLACTDCMPIKKTKETWKRGVARAILSCPIYAMDRLNLEFEIDTELTAENTKHIVEGIHRDKFFKLCIKIASKSIVKSKNR